MIVMIYIVLPVFNRLNSTKQFLKSLSEQTYSEFEVVICDDGSTDETSEYITENYRNVILIQGSGSLWWTAGINKCIEYVLSKCNEQDYILTLNNDVLLAKDYLEQKLARASKYKDAIIGSMCVYGNAPDLIETTGFVMDFKRCIAKPLTKVGEKRKASHSGVRQVTQLPGKGVLIPIKIFRDIGLYDAENFPHYHADSDLILRAFRAGYQVLLDYDSVVLSDVNKKNLGFEKETLTVRGFINTFKGPYSLNNYIIRRNFARKHFPKCTKKYLIKVYFRIIGGFILRYLKTRFQVFL